MFNVNKVGDRKGSEIQVYDTFVTHDGKLMFLIYKTDMGWVWVDSREYVPVYQRPNAMSDVLDAIISLKKSIARIAKDNNL